MMNDDARTRAQGIPTLVENELLVQIKVLYEDVTTNSKTKKTERERLTKQFVKECSKMLSLPEDKVRSIVDIVIANTKWIKEIEEIDEEIEDETK